MSVLSSVENGVLEQEIIEEDPSTNPTAPALDMMITEERLPLKEVTLHEHQMSVVNEAISRKIGLGGYGGTQVPQGLGGYGGTQVPQGLCLSLPMGYGKTIMSLYLGLKLYESVYHPFLVICSKTLIASWINEITKFYEDTLRYEILHQDYLGNKMKTWKPDPQTRVVITTPEVLTKSYTDLVKSRFVGRVQGVWQNDNDYLYPANPFALIPEKPGPEYLHSVRWPGVFIDECQNYTSVTSNRCQAIASLCSTDRWLLSGTLLQEVNLERILGLFLLLNVRRPRNITDCKQLVYYNQNFQGLKTYCISRTDNPNFTGVQLNSQVITFNLSHEEGICYNMLREIITNLWAQYQQAVAVRDPRWARKVVGSLLAMITYLRQALVIPQIPICKLITKMAEEGSGAVEGTASGAQNENNDLANFQTISNTVTNTLREYGLNDWLTREESQVSTRVQNCLDILLQHQDDLIVVFASYTVTLNFLKEKYNELVNTPTFLLSCDMNIKKRTAVLQQFEQAQNGVLFMTYMMGSEGLNLQRANTVVHLDLYWNKGKENQALARVFRSGQLSPMVHQYILISNTGLEQKMLQKQRDKLTILQQLKEGNIHNRQITGMPLRELVSILQGDEVGAIAREVNNWGRGRGAVPL